MSSHDEVQPALPPHLDNQSRSNLDKVEHLGLLALTGSWEYIKKDPGEIAIKAAEGLAIGVAIATAPAWLGVAAGVAGVGLLGKEIYDKGKEILPALEIVWQDGSQSTEVKKAEDVISSQLGATLVDSAVMFGVGMGAGKLAGTIRNATKGLDNEQMERIVVDAGKRMRELGKEYKAEMEARQAAGEFGEGGRRPGGFMTPTEPKGLIRGLDALDPEIGRHFNGHGIAKGSWTEQMATLQQLLTKGVDPNRRFYEMPLRGMEEYGAIFGADRPFDTGSFIVLAEAGAKGGISKNGIKYVLVNDPYYGGLQELQTAFPKVQFIRADQVRTTLPKILQAKEPKLYAEAVAKSAQNSKAAAQ